MKTDKRKQKRIDRESVVLLYKAGYSLEDLAEIFKKEDGTPTSKSVVSRILKEQREILRDPIERGVNRIPPNKMPQAMINILTRALVFPTVLELYNRKYQNRGVKDTTFKKHPSKFSKQEVQLFQLGRQLYFLRNKGMDLNKVAEKNNIPPNIALQSLNFYKKYAS